MIAVVLTVENVILGVRKRVNMGQFQLRSKDFKMR